MSFFERHSNNQDKSSPVKEWFTKGQDYLSNQKYEKAVDAFTSVISIDAKYEQAYCERGNAYSNLNQYEKALADYSQAILINPNYAGAYLIRGYIYSTQKQYENAVSDYSKAIELNESYDIAYYNRGQAYGHLGQYDKAIESYTSAITLNSNYAEAYTKRGITLGLSGDTERSLSDLKKASELGDKTADEFLKQAGISGQENKTMYSYTIIELTTDCQVVTDTKYSPSKDDYIQYLSHFSFVSFESPKKIKAVIIQLTDPSSMWVCNIYLHEHTFETLNSYPEGKMPAPIGRLQLTLSKERGPELSSYF